MSFKVLVTYPPILNPPGRHTELLQEAGCEVRQAVGMHPLSSSELLGQVRDVDAILAGADRITATVLAEATRLKVISLHGVGYDRVDLEAATRAGVVVTIAAGSNHVSVVELTMGMMIALARHIVQQNDKVRHGECLPITGTELAGKTVGIVGLGRIGKALAVRLAAMEMQVLAHDIQTDPDFAEEHGIRYMSMEEVLHRSDFVCLHASATSGAPPILGEAQFALMKPTAYFINAARGALIDEGALYRALSRGELAGAALDVLTSEPSFSSPLLELENVLVTPHIGANTFEARARASLMVVQNALQVLAGQRCLNVVNPEAYGTKPGVAK